MVMTSCVWFLFLWQLLVEFYMPSLIKHLEPSEYNALFANVMILKGVNETLLEHLMASRELHYSPAPLEASHFFLHDTSASQE